MLGGHFHSCAHIIHEIAAALRPHETWHEPSPLRTAALDEAQHVLQLSEETSHVSSWCSSCSSFRSVWQRSEHVRHSMYSSEECLGQETSSCCMLDRNDCAVLRNECVHVAVLLISSAILLGERASVYALAAERSEGEPTACCCKARLCVLS